MNQSPINPTDDQKDDVDPVIDTLLLEFVSEDPGRRIGPPDLSGEILAKLAELKTQPATTPSYGNELSGRTPLVRAVSIMIAVAAAIIGVMWLAGANDSSSSDDSNRIAEEVSPTAPLDRALVEKKDGLSSENALAGSPSSTDKPVAEKKPATGIRLDKPESPDRRIASTSKGTLSSSGTQSDGVEPIQDVAQRVASHTRQYWERIGVKPSREATFGEIAKRMQSRLDIAVRSDWLDDSDALRDQLARTNVARSLARQWLSDTTGASMDQVRDKKNTDLVNQVGDAFAGQRSFDTTFVSLVDGSAEQSENWYGLLSEGKARDHQVFAIAGQLAQLTMNADLRCVRCHDSMIGRMGTQDDHWSFVAMVKQSIRRQDGGWKVAKSESAGPTFYELSDGRQRLAQPSVSSTLLNVETAPQDFEAWTGQLASSEEFANSVVDSLWAMVHGRSLSPAPMDAFAPPSDETLDQIRAELARDLRSSGFDVARTLSLIITSPMNRRSIPESLRPENSLVASDADRETDLEKVAAFAAAVETPVAKRWQRIELAMKRVGGKIDSVKGDTLLAQPIMRPSSESQAKPVSVDPKQLFAQQLSVDFPGDDAGLPVSWLRSIKDYDQQVQHLVYLSGGHRVPGNIAEAAKRLRDAGTPESALSRLWWILND